MAFSKRRQIRGRRGLGKSAAVFESPRSQQGFDCRGFESKCPKTFYGVFGNDLGSKIKLQAIKNAI